MTQQEIKICLEQGEGTRIEYKEARGKAPSDLYETIVSFSNKDGGIVLIGVSDNGDVIGLNNDNVSQMKQDITTACNNPGFINPPISITPMAVDYETKQLLILKIPTSSQIHTLNGVIYDRENDSDIRIIDQARISDMYFRKRNIFTETQIYPAVTWDDLKTELFDKARTIIRGADPAHPWLSMDNMELMRSATLYAKDFKTGEVGFSLAGVLLFGKDETIQNILPAYKVEALVRRENLDRWDDRLTLRANLMETYFQLMDFIRKHLPSKFYLEDAQRKDLRDIIFRELIGNILCHREYTSHHSTELVIYRDKVIATNPNKAIFHGMLDIHAFNPFAKNPNIRKFFSALSWADEIGSGVRNMTKYMPLYISGDAIPVFLEDDVFKTEVPLIVYTWQPYAKQFISLFENISEECQNQMIKNMVTLPVAADIADEQAEFEEFLIKKVSIWSEKGGKLHGLRLLETKGVTKDFSKKVTSTLQKGGKLFDKRTEYILKVLVLAIEPISPSELMNMLNYAARDKFKDMYIKPLFENHFLRYTISDKPTSSKQQYVTTEKGRLFLGGFEI